MDRFDERDTIFSRMTLQRGSDRYIEQYRRRPEKKEIDDRLRDAGEGTFSRRLPEASMVETTFALITRLREFVRGFDGEYSFPRQSGPEKEPSSEETLNPEELTSFLKKTAASYGAVASGVTATDEACVYSVRGRGERYGRAVDDALPVSFVYAFEMSVEEMRTAPGIREAAEVAGTYLRVAVPALLIASYLRGLGYRAIAHMDGESELVLPPLAERAGLGQIGRHGLLVNRRYGSRIRLGAITTDAELLYDQPVDFKLPKVCEVCRKCAELCPAGAIPSGSILGDYDVQVRSIDHDACFAMWRRFGTDCGVCVSACPYSKVGLQENRKNRAGVNGGEDDGDGARTEAPRAGTAEGQPKPGHPDFLKSFMFGK